MSPTADLESIRRELSRKTNEARVLRQVSTRINATLDPREILEIVLGTLDELFGFDHSLILLVDHAGARLTVAGSRGYGGEGIGATVDVGVGVLGMVAKKRRMMTVNNLRQQRQYVSAVRRRMEEVGAASGLGRVVPLPGLPEAESQVAIPLLIESTLVGVLSVESAEPRQFGEDDENLLSIVANQVASAIHNAQVHERLKQLNETLEERVRERTAELQQAYRELSETQAQLLQSGKMASLGQLAAGVAHEINTPIGSLRSNTDVVARALEIIREGLPQPADRRVERAVSALESGRRISREACDRIERIVTSLRTFARLDEAARKRVDLHEGIESALVLVQHALAGRIEVVRRFGELPPVECYPDQINQVFMNLLLNAVAAIPGQGTITLDTAREGPWVVARVADSGRGIAADQLERIFDPGYTTKGVGVGTGLGLAICYRIMQTHGGSISVESALGEGSVFTLRMPVDLTDRA